MTRRAILIDGIQVGAPRVQCGGPPNPSHRLTPALDDLLELLTLLEFEDVWWLTAGEGPAATRDFVSQWKQTIDPGDEVLFYYFGHGLRVHLRDPKTGAPLSATPFAVLECGLYDFELSRHMAELAADQCRVTVILDCCYGADVVRGDDSRLAKRGTSETDARVGFRNDVNFGAFVDAGEQTLGHLAKARSSMWLAADGHPSIVRLTASTSVHRAYSRPKGERGCMTRKLVELIRELEAGGVDVRTQVSWSMLVHGLRQRVREGWSHLHQRITLSGPGDLSVCSSKLLAAAPRTVGYQHEYRRWGQLDAGWGSGLAVGDRWVICQPWLDASGHSIEVARASVVRVDFDGATVLLDTSRPELASAIGLCAYLERSAHPLVVDCGPRAIEAPRSSIMRALLDESISSGDARIRVIERDDEIELVDAADRVLLSVASEERSQIEARLDDLACRGRILRMLANHPGQAGGVVNWQVLTQAQEGEVGSSAATELSSGATLHCGDRVLFRIDNQSLGEDCYYASIIHLDPGGRVYLMQGRQPDGIHVAPGVIEAVGTRPGGVGAGLILTWPKSTPEHTPLPASFVLLSSTRPLNLAHLVRWQLCDLDEAWRAEGLPGDREQVMRGPFEAPISATAWGWRRIDYTLSPSPRANN